MRHLGLLISGIILTVGSIIFGVILFVYESEAAPNMTVVRVSIMETLVLAIPLIVAFLIGLLLLANRRTKIKNENTQASLDV